VVAAVFAAESWSNIGSWANTDSLFEHLLQVQPDNYLAMSMAAERLVSTDPTQSLALGKRAVELAPLSPQVHLSYGVSLQAAGKLDQAAEQMRRGAELDASQTVAWEVLGGVREKQAAQCAQNADPREIQFRLNAVTSFKNALMVDPANIIAMGHLGYQLATLGRLNEAISYWQRAVQLAPEDAQNHGDLADALRLKQDLAGAVEQYRAALADGSKDPAWETQLSYLVATNPAATAQEIQPLVAIAKDACDQTRNHSPAALDAYAACLARVGRFDDAIAAAQQGVAQANAANQPAVAAGIQRRLDLYKRGLPYVAGEATTKPTTRNNE
jgi:tetratricopeptide (TPR) repeat protein